MDGLKWLCINSVLNINFSAYDYDVMIKYVFNPNANQQFIENMHYL